MIIFNRRGGLFKRDSLKHLKREIKEGVKDIKDEVKIKKGEHNQESRARKGFNRILTNAWPAQKECEKYST